MVHVHAEVDVLPTHFSIKRYTPMTSCHFDLWLTVVPHGEQPFLDRVINLAGYLL